MLNKSILFLTSKVIQKGEIKMIRQKTLWLIPAIILANFAYAMFLPNLSEAAVSTTGYDFGEVELGSSETTFVNISNLGSAPVTLTGLVFDKTSCSDFSVITLPESMTILSNETVNVEIGYSPTTIGDCSEILRVYTGTPFPSQISFSGIGIEPTSLEQEAFNMAQPLLIKVENIIGFTNKCIEDQSLNGYGRGKSAEKRLNAFKKMLVVAYHLLDNGHFEAARKKLIAIYKKADGEPSPKDLVTGINAPELASKIYELITDFDFG
jgi:hypothetical protein